MEQYVRMEQNLKGIINMSQSSSNTDTPRFPMILKFNGELEAFLTAYAEQQQFRSVQELLTMLVREYAKQHGKELPPQIKLHTNSRRMSWRAPDDLDAFLEAFTTAYDFTSKPELVKQIAREFYQAQKATKRKV
jgi:hypothetical protein